MFSVIIPLYNKANYIEKAVASVLVQTHPEIDLIIIDDGSTDGGANRLAHLTDARLTIIRQLNAGVSVARNNGVGAARFGYIAFLDADDWWHPRFLETMAELIALCPDAGLLGSAYFVVKNQRNVPAQVGLSPEFPIGYIDYFAVYADTFWVPINCSFVVVKRTAFLDNQGFNPALKFGEDLDLWVRIALQHRVAYANRCLAYSNQDADTAHRALGTDRCWHPSEHVTFQFGQFVRDEQQNPTLKRLLDGLRVRSLLPYRRNGWHVAEVRACLGQVHMAGQPLFYRIVYTWPLPIVNGFFLVKKWGSAAKRWLLRLRTNPLPA